MSKRVQVLLTDEQYQAIHGRCKNDSESVKDLMMLGMEYEKNVSRKQKIVFDDIDLSDNEDLKFLIYFAAANCIHAEDFLSQLKGMIIKNEIKFVNKRVKIE